MRRARFPLLELCQLLAEQVPETRLYSLNALAERTAKLRAVWEFILGPEPTDEEEVGPEAQVWDWVNDLLAVKEEKGYALAIKNLPYHAQIALKASIPPSRPTSFQRPRRIFGEDKL